jgi:general secretion pathway protein D
VVVAQKVAVRVLALLLGSMLAWGCAEQARQPRPALPPVPSLTPRPASPPITTEPIPLTPESAEREARRPVGGIFRGNGELVGRPPQRAEAALTPQGDVTLNFVNADIRDVAKAVLGDLLKVNYIVAPSAQGTVTLQTSRPLPRSEILPTLETALRFSDVALVEVGGVYQIVPAGDAPRQGARILRNPASSGSSLQIVPLRYVSADEMQRVLDPLAPAGSVVRVDNARNILVLAGTQRELATLTETISIFDVNWLAGMSFALFPLKIAAAKGLAAELAEVLGGAGSPVAGLVRIVPIERMNAIMAISPRAQLLEQVQAWVDRLDRGNERDDQRIYVYRVQNGRASDLASVLSKALTGESQSAGTSGRQGDAVAALYPPATMLNTPGGAVSVLPPDAPGLAPPPATGLSPRSPLAPDTERGESAGNRLTQGGRIRITADETNNSLLIVGTAREFATIEAALRRLDVLPLQVLIEAVIAEVTLTNDLRYGVQYLLRSGNFQFSNFQTSAAGIALQPGFSALFLPGVDNRVVLNLLESVTNVNVVSSPQVMVLNNQTATLQVGDQVPIATQSAVSVLTPNAPIVNTIQFRDTGVILKVTPRVNESGLVLLDIAQEVSDVAATTTSTIDSPTIQQRRVTSSVAVRDSELVALGGLIRDSQTRAKSGIPVLQDIPLFGPLFGTRTNNVQRTELLILITPHVVRTPEDARGIAEEMQQRMRALAPLRERIQ